MFRPQHHNYKITVINIVVESGAKLTLKGTGYVGYTVKVSSGGKLILPTDWTGTIKNVTLNNSEPGLTMESGTIEDLGLFTDGSKGTIRISGGTFKKIWNRDNDGIWMKNFLKSEYAFKQGTEMLKYDTEIPSNTPLTNITVVLCKEHRNSNNGKNVITAIKHKIMLSK